MAGKIRAVDVEYVKTHANISDIISDYVALKPAGVDSYKGLCPFHDERSPSFHVRPSAGFFHCFGCGESGDVISFLQKQDHLTFVEAVERLATKLNFQLTYEEGSFRQETRPNKTRILEANLKAQKFFTEQLFKNSGATARQILNERGFDDAALKRFDLGFALPDWHSLLNHLKSNGFTEEELIKAGLVAEGARGPYDRFRGRIIWPIKDASGQTIGFGARKTLDNDEGPKYLNTPETDVYQKSRVLYGLDIAKKAIATKKQVVVVEGYTDVMACHLAGVTTAVATCGTAFAAEHIVLLRRMMSDDPSAQVIFTFDPDEAGIKAALRAFSNEHLFSAQTYVAVSHAGLDPADLRFKKGDEALHEMFAEKQPLFSFALKQEINKYDLNTSAGRVTALRQTAPILAGIRDSQMLKEHARELSIMLGFELAEVTNAIRFSARTRSFHQSDDQPVPAPVGPQKNNSHSYRLERDAVIAMVQFPSLIGLPLLQQAISSEIFDADLRVIRDAVAARLDKIDDSNWLTSVSEVLPINYTGFLHELAVTPVPQKHTEQLQSYSKGIVKALLERDLLSLKREMVLRLQRIDDLQSEQYRNTQQQIQMLEQARRSLLND